EARTALGQGLRENGPHLGEEQLRLCPAQSVRRLVVVDACRPQRFVRIDIADAADEVLVEQRPLDSGAARGERGEEAALVEGRIQRVTGDVGDAAGYERLRRSEPASPTIRRRHQLV